MTEGPVLRIFIQILLGLHFCHTSTVGKQQILHRDLKPENGERIDNTASCTMH